MDKNIEQNLIEKIIESKVAWLVFLVGAIWAVVTTIIIPINNIQNAQANIQVTLNEVKSINAGFDSRITDNSNDIIVIQQEIKNLLHTK